MSRNTNKSNVYTNNIKKIMEKNSGILLDIGAGENKQPGFIGMDKRSLPGVDMVHDLETFPYPLPDECCLTIIGSHIIEHLSPKITIDFFNELWRIMKPNGQLALSTPYAGSPGYWQDPTHCNGFSEITFLYFDPKSPILYPIYKPKPWKIDKGFPVWQSTNNLEVMMRKMSIKDSEKILKEMEKK